MKGDGVEETRLQLLREVSGAFRPGVLTALMGVSGAGKTTLMDVLAGRKTGGYIEGDIRVSGYPKNQETFARVSGYCEQNDIHSPHVTVYESLLYSAWLRLPADVNTATRQVRRLHRKEGTFHFFYFSCNDCKEISSADVRRGSDGLSRAELVEERPCRASWSRWLINRTEEKAHHCSRVSSKSINHFHGRANFGSRCSSCSHCYARCEEHSRHRKNRCLHDPSTKHRYLRIIRRGTCFSNTVL